MQGNLKFILNNLLNGKYVKPFKKEDEIINIITASFTAVCFCESKTNLLFLRLLLTIHIAHVS